MSPAQPAPSLNLPIAILTGLAVLALLDSLFNYFWPTNGIHGTEGALLVIVSTLLMAAAALAVAAGWAKGWVRTLLIVLIGLDLLGTGFAAYFLEAWLLLVLDILAAIPWLAIAVGPRRALSPSRTG